MNGIIAFFSALPRIFALLDSLGRLFNSEEFKHFMSETEQNVDLLKKAITPNDKIAAAQALDDTIRAL